MYLRCKSKLQLARLGVAVIASCLTVQVACSDSPNDPRDDADSTVDAEDADVGDRTTDVVDTDTEDAEVFADLTVRSCIDDNGQLLIYAESRDPLGCSQLVLTEANGTSNGLELQLPDGWNYASSSVDPDYCFEPLLNPMGPAVDTAKGTIELTPSQGRPENVSVDLLASFPTSSSNPYEHPVLMRADDVRVVSSCPGPDN